jgi:hypothetical protein
MPDHPIVQHETAAPPPVQVNQNLVLQANLSYGGAKSSGAGQGGQRRIHAGAFHPQEYDHGELGLTAPLAPLPARAMMAGRPPGRRTWTVWVSD